MITQRNHLITVAGQLIIWFWFTQSSDQEHWGKVIVTIFFSEKSTNQTKLLKLKSCHCSNGIARPFQFHFREILHTFVLMQGSSVYNEQSEDETSPSISASLKVFLNHIGRNTKYVATVDSRGIAFIISECF